MRRRCADGMYKRWKTEVPYDSPHPPKKNKHSAKEKEENTAIFSSFCLRLRKIPEDHTYADRRAFPAYPLPTHVAFATFYGFDPAGKAGFSHLFQCWGLNANNTRERHARGKSGLAFISAAHENFHRPTERSELPAFRGSVAITTSSTAAQS